MYIYYIRMIFAKMAKYHMGIIWIWCGYHMVRPSADIVNE